MTNVNYCLAYEILLYLNSFYLGMFFVCEAAMGILKVINVPYPENVLIVEALIFFGVCAVEVLRLFMGRKGNFANKYTRWLIYLSLVLTITSGAGVGYLLFWQTYILRLEYILCSVMLIFQTMEVTFATFNIFIQCKKKQIDR